MRLIDTSAWIEYLRRTGSPANEEVRRLLVEAPGEVAVTEPVVMELPAGPTDPKVVAKFGAAGRRPAAARTGAVVVHRDRDFTSLAACLPDLAVQPL